MSLTCTVCASPDRAELERRLVSGASQRAMAAQFGVGRSAIRRHVASGHVPVLVIAEQNAERELHAVDLAERVEFLWRKASAILEQAESDGRATIALQAVRELRATVELLARLSGALDLAERGEVVVELTFADGRTAWPSTEMVPGKVIRAPARGLIDRAPEGGDSA